MSFIDFTFTTTKRARDASALLKGIAESNDEKIENLSVYSTRYFTDDPRSTIDGLIEAEVIIPTEDYYVLHE